MGTTYSSLSLPGAVSERVDELLRSWLHTKGYDPVESFPFVSTDPATERGYFLFASERWTVLLYSALDEQTRVKFELNKVGLPLLHLWLFDSDVWGYELERGETGLSSFSSSRGFHGADQVPPGPDDPLRVITECGLDLSTWRLRRLRRGKPLFIEAICERFAHALGMLPAASCYEYEESEPGEPPPGFTKMHRVFRRTTEDPMGGFDLHGTPARSWNSEEKEISSPAPEPSMQKPGLPLIARIVLAYHLRRWKRALIPERVNVSSTKLPFDSSILRPPSQSGHSEGEFYVDRRFGYRVRLAEGVLADIERGTVSLRHGDLRVSVRPRRPVEIRALLAGNYGHQFVSEENTSVGGFPAKFLRAVRTRTEECFYLIQGPNSILEFATFPQGRVPEDAANAIVETVRSLELTGEAGQAL